MSNNENREIVKEIIEIIKVNEDKKIKLINYFYLLFKIIFNLKLFY